MDKEQYLREHPEQRQRCEVWSRVMGYHRPVEQWNDGKQSEFKDRRMFSEEKAKERL